jgi:carbonic anhydrase/acetyltransferase-like protein (isoleucine patch superfamily)
MKLELVSIVDGSAVARVQMVKVIAATAEFAGEHAHNGTVIFVEGTSGLTGSIEAGEGVTGGWCVVKTAASGIYEGRITNIADEVVYFSAATCEGGVDALATAALVHGCKCDEATWS